MSQEILPEFGISKNIKQVGRIGLPDGVLVTHGKRLRLCRPY